MATQSPPPTLPSPTATDENQGGEIIQPTNMDQQNAGDEPVKPSSPTSVFVNSQPLREEQVQNAVKFLSHPKVKGSPVMYRRSFLEKKGLTKEEIDEAFRRVPDSAPTVQTAGVNQDGQLQSSSNTQQQAQQQTLQPALPASAGVNTSSGILSRTRFHWSHALVVVGLLSASGAGTVLIIKNSLLPRLKAWIRKVVLDEDDEQSKKTSNKPTLAEEAAQAAKSAAAAAADVAKASQEMLASKGEERKYFVEVVSLLDKQIQEMKLMTNAIRRLEGQEDLRVSQTSSKRLIANGKTDYDLRSGRSLSPPAPVEPSGPPHPKSYMEIMAMVQRGEKPSNIRDINDLPPNPSQQPSDPRILPKSKPWETGQVQNTSSQLFQPQANGEESNIKVQDITQSNGDDPMPWWQKKNVRIREIEENESSGAPYGTASSQQPLQRVWVPPQPPPIAMAEAAEAIRRPKQAVQKEQVSENQSVAQSSDISGEVNGIPKPAESEGVERSNGSSIISSSEIQVLQEDHEAKYEEQ
ncbi:peroxisomal membrane protein PEX14 isoform X2 [Cicer arietinum]|uniref:Peroxisomal membrane protein PEX14 n=1 Tax=Cicer arietinum TaxID=3827 RepID=A0A1S2YRQ4_CICAR|nr:peroxisomal membrane protein PEX14 isoform X2 [Cicer arietinum]